MAVDGRYCLIHATHATEAEISRLARHAVTIGLSKYRGQPGDGIFAAARLSAAADGLALVQIATSVLRRSMSCGFGIQPKTAARSTQCPGQTRRRLDRRIAVASGSRWRSAGIGPANRRPCSRIARRLGGSFRRQTTALYGRHGSQILDAAMFGPDRDAVSDVMVQGRWVVRSRRHSLKNRSPHASARRSSDSRRRGREACSAETARDARVYVLGLIRCSGPLSHIPWRRSRRRQSRPRRWFGCGSRARG